MTATPTFFDNTRVSSFKTCARKYYYEHVRAWRPDSKSVALTFGSSWHAAMDVVWKNYPKPSMEAELNSMTGLASDVKKAIVRLAYKAFVDTWTADKLPHPDELGPDELEDFAPRTPQVAKEMLYEYIDARMHIFSDPSFETLAIEQPFAVPLSPDDPSLFYIGRLDKVFAYRKQILVGEHKTTSFYKKDGPFRAEFVDSFAVNSQIDGYVYALKMLYGDRAAGVWIDGALVHKTVHDGFMFIPESRSAEQTDAWLWSTHHYIDQIAGNNLALAERAHDDTPYLAAFPQNTASCGSYGGCPFRSICQVIANPAKLTDPPLGFHYEPWDPLKEIDLSKLDKPLAS